MSWTRVGQVTGELQSAKEYQKAGLSVGDPTISSTKKYSGSYSLRYGVVVGGVAVDAVGVAFAAADQVRTHFWLYHNGVQTSTNFTPIVRITGSDSAVLGLITSGGTTYLRLINNAGTTLAETPAAATGITNTGAWHGVGVLFSKNASFTVWVNGVQVLQHTTGSDINYQPSGVYVGRSTATAAWANYAYYDDLYVDTGSGNAVGTPSSCRFLPAFPAGAGADTEWTPNTGANYAALAEAPPDDDTTYVKAAGAGLRDLYPFTAITVPADYGVRAVIIAPYAERTDAAVASTLKVVAVDGTAETLGDALVLPTTYGYVWQRLATAPDGNGWSEAVINAAEFGIESSGVYS